MSKFSAFMKQNKQEKKNEEYAPTRSMIGSDGTPLRWEFRHMSSKENEDLRDSCTIDVPVTGKPNLYRQRFLTKKYIIGMIVNCTVVPNLFDAELQNSYGVTTPEDLIYAMVDDPGEFTDLYTWLQRFNGFDESLDEKVETAKN